MLLGHLVLAKQAQLIDLIEKYCVLFGDTPTQTDLLDHDIEVGDAKPIRQHSYRVNSGKHRFLDEEVQYMLDNEIAEISNFSWASPCLFLTSMYGRLQRTGEGLSMANDTLLYKSSPLIFPFRDSMVKNSSAISNLSLMPSIKIKS